MPYNEREYAILVASGMNMRGMKAIEWIKDNFKIEIPESTYWRHYAKIQATTFSELEWQSVHKVQVHIERINYFKHLRAICNGALEQIEDPYKKILASLKVAELEKYIAQLESMSAKYYAKAVQEAKSDGKLELKPVAV